MNDTLSKYNESRQIEKQEKKQSSMTARDFLSSDKFKSGIAQVLPKYLTPDRMVRCALAAIIKTPKLAQCTRESIIDSMMTLSQLGLEPDGRRAHLIPYWNGKRKTMECQVIIDYKGMVSLIMNTGLFSRIHADVVCKNDDFEYDKGVVTKHKVNFSEPRGEIYAAWCVIVQKDGAEKYEVMPRDEIESIRSRSKSSNSGPWVTDYAEMCKKTVFRRASKWVPWEKAGERFETVESALNMDDVQFEIDDFSEEDERTTLEKVVDKAKVNTDAK